MEHVDELDIKGFETIKNKISQAGKNTRTFHLRSFCLPGRKPHKAQTSRH
jgi:hypothetical protein